jgi:hypothetical protein
MLYHQNNLNDNRIIVNTLIKGIIYKRNFMHLWDGSLSDFIKEGEAGALTGEMLQTFWNHHRYQPSVAETISWDNPSSVFKARTPLIGSYDTHCQTL